MLCFEPIPIWQASINIPHSFGWYILGSFPAKQTVGSTTLFGQNAKNVQTGEQP
jgi:hypothetical protein